MAKNYTKEDIKKVSYSEFWGWVKKLTSEVKKVIEKKTWNRYDSTNNEKLNDICSTFGISFEDNNDSSLPS